MIDFITSNLLWTQGRFILFAIAVVAGISYIYWRPFLYVTLAFFVFSFYFFRNPTRECVAYKMDPIVLICPADGKVVDIVYDQENGLQGYAQKVSIFLSPLDVHVNWLPTDGTIEQITYTPGKFIMAFLPKSSELNEHNDVIIRHANGNTIKVRQIAGFIARRICWWVSQGQLVSAGQKYGMIRFGSRVDIFLPSCVMLQVGVGQRVSGGSTVLGRWTCQSLPNG